MKTFPVSMLAMAFLCFILTFSFSCNKDSDLLADYISINPSSSITAIEVIANPNESVVIAVLGKSSDSVVTEVSDPLKGTAVINKDNTITYTPDAGATGTDEFDYYTALTSTTGKSDRASGKNKGQVKVTISDGTADSTTGSTAGSNTVSNAEVDYWQSRFDLAWSTETTLAASYTGLGSMINADMATALSLSGNVNAEFYYLAYYLDALTQIWKATGDNKYLDTNLRLINNAIDSSVDLGNGYNGWPNKDNNGNALWDSYCWRFVTTLLNVMHRSPTLLASGNYQAQYQKILDFTEKNIWGRYEAAGVNNFYRVNTHMASHWARIGMDLYSITGKSKYKEVFDNISFGKMVGRPSNLRNQFKSDPKVSSAYTWSSSWGGTTPQDTSHGGAVVSFLVAAFENDMYWTRNDINALASTLKNVVWLDQNGGQFFSYVDGSGGFDLPGRLNEWLNLGRFDPEIQDKIKFDYTGKNLKYYGVESLGIAALNARILADGAPLFPEF